VRDWLRARATTTPGTLALLAVLVVAGAACFGVIATTAERSRAHAAEAARAQTELLRQAVRLYTSLSDANATAATTFLTGGLEPPARRARYLQDLNAASGALATLTQNVGGDSEARSAVRTITEQVPLYAGLIESARANNREGLPIGAAYLRNASTLLTGTILPAADRLYAAEASRLTDDYGTGTATTAVVVLGLVAIVALGLLVWTQSYLTRISRRVLNPLVVVSTVVLAAVSVWAVIGMLNEQSALTSARGASDSVEVLSATRVLLARAQSDESVTLANRGSDEVDPVDFGHVMAALASSQGLLAEVSQRARASGTPGDAQRLDAAFRSFQANAARITALENNGQTGQAITAATSPAATAVTDRLSANLAAQISAAQRRAAVAGRSATSSLTGLSLAIPLLTAVVAALAVLGIRQRLREYR
jgi:hypothetical protein